MASNLRWTNLFYITLAYQEAVAAQTGLGRACAASSFTDHGLKNAYVWFFFFSVADPLRTSSNFVCKPVEISKNARPQATVELRRIVFVADLVQSRFVSQQFKWFWLENGKTEFFLFLGVAILLKWFFQTNSRLLAIPNSWICLSSKRLTGLD